MRGLTYISTCLTPLGTEAALWLLLALPLAGALVCGAIASRSGGGRAAGRLAAIIAVSAVAVTFVAAVVMVMGQLLALPEGERLLRTPTTLSSLSSSVGVALFTVGGLRVNFGLFMDPLAAVMVLVVTGLGALIHAYAARYMRDDPARPRFFAFLNLFVGSMLLLVLGDGLVPLFFGWEGVGMCSYFLIGFWHRRPGAVEAAQKAFIVNRVGDAALILGVGLVMWGLANVGTRPGELGSLEVEARAGAAVPPAPNGAPLGRRAPKRRISVGPTLSFSEMRDQLGVEIELPPALARAKPGEPEAHAYPARTLLGRMTVVGLPLSFVACLLIFLGAAGKSAQLPFSAWLPDAMAGPTPVSALIHAATLVTAGVYLLARLGFLFALSPGAMTVVVATGTATALGAAAVALFQNDLKRVLAYSTISQLGYMFAAMAGGGSAGIFHVVTHGFFKACLFLSAGVIIHAVEARLAAGSDAEHGAEHADPQDLRNMGGLAAALPWTRRAYLVACLGLAGFPVASGFFSKDQIFAAVATSPQLMVSPSIVLGALAVTTFLTACYAFRSYYLVFHGAAARSATAASSTPAATEPRLLIGVVLALAAGTIVVGPWLGWPSIWTAAHGRSVLARFLAPVFAGNLGATPPAEVRPAVEWGLQAGGLVLAVLGFWVARGLYGRGPGPRDGQGHAQQGAGTFVPALARFLAAGAGLDVVYRTLAVRPVLASARAATWLDRRVFDRVVDGIAAAGVTAARLVGMFDRRVVDGAVDGVSAGVIATGRRAARLQSGRLNSYVVALVAGIAGLVVLAYFFSS